MRYKCIRKLPFCDVGDEVEIHMPVGGNDIPLVQASAGRWEDWRISWGNINDWFEPIEDEGIEELKPFDGWPSEIEHKINELVREVNKLKKG